MAYVYPFTNENVTSYEKLYDFDNARVLSVLGSGDQYFSSLLYGAREVELFDINNFAYDFFLLKYYGIMLFSYEEFYDYFVVKELDDLRYFRKLVHYLPMDVLDRLCNLYNVYNGLSRFLYSNVINVNERGNAIPYFNKNNYYRLQAILACGKIPKFYLSDFVNLPNRVSGNRYDVILTSNIFDWLYKDFEVESVGIYKELLEKFNYSEIQALYFWNNLSNDLKFELLKNGFEIDSVPSAGWLSLTKKNMVASLRQKK